jgi:anti-anti-sigma regulatory factor
MVVDLSAAEFVDSLGLRGLLGCARDAHLAGTRLRVFAPHGHQARVLMDLSGTGKTLGVMPD